MGEKYAEGKEERFRGLQSFTVCLQVVVDGQTKLNMARPPTCRTLIYLQV